jgi:hypothetical protein
MRKAIMLILLLFGIAISGYADANYVRPFDADEQMQRSNLVIVGLIESIFIDENVKAYESKYARVNVKLVIKGDKSYAGKTIILPVRGGAPEFYLIHCCTVGKNYVMFLEGTKDELLFTSVNIDHSIYEIP